MKNIYAKKIALAFLLSLSAFVSFSCQGVVYDNIRKEVALEDGNIAGDIRAIVRFKDKYYLANGGIYFKNKDANFYGAWQPCLSPSGQVIKLAADKNYLYALVGISAEYEKDGTNIGVSRQLYYSADGVSWSLVTGVGTGGTIVYNKNYIVYTYLFCTNAINEDNRSAYLVLNDGTKGLTNKAYKLNGAAVTEMALGTVNAGTKPFSNALLVSRSCVYYNGNVYFFSSNGSTTNETSTTPATMYYYGLGAYLCWGGEKISTTGLLCADTIQSLGVTADYILIGTNSGMHHKVLTSKVPGATVNFTTNAAATMSGAYVVLSMLVTNPELNELQTPIYASQVYTGNGSSNSAQFDHVGLWAYYPARGNWNRE
ncbi:MAG: hypothetical protein K6A42_09675 [Treponema sp.]|nr:hypothetical protein [Treponema sp.]